MIFRYIAQRLKTQFLGKPVSLRLLMAVGVSLPILMILTILSLFHYWQEYHLLEAQQRFSSIQLGSLLSHSLSHSLRNKDGSALIATFSEVGHSENVMGMEIIGQSGHVLFASDMHLSSSAVSTSDVGCWACHKIDSNVRPRTVDLVGDIRGMRIATPIANDPECVRCHSAEDKNLGMLILDISLAEVRSITLSNLARDIAISAIATILLTFFAFYLINFLVVRRIEAFKPPMAAYAAGDFSMRVSEKLVLNDEIDALARTLNGMADNITQHAKEQESKAQVRQNAIIEERERIGRELHDGLAQVLGYVATKATAVRLLLQKNSLRDADINLSQLEDAARALLADMREDILGLKTASQVDSNVGNVLHEYVDRYNTLADIPVTLTLPANGEIILDPGVVLQLTRIVQEALANARKHSAANQISIQLFKLSDSVALEVMDNGRGFDVAAMEGKRGRFGLSTMRERAAEIGAILSIRSSLNVGTTVRVELGIKSGRKS